MFAIMDFTFCRFVFWGRAAYDGIDVYVGKFEAVF